MDLLDWPFNAHICIMARVELTLEQIQGIKPHPTKPKRVIVVYRERSDDKLARVAWLFIVSLAPFSAASLGWHSMVQRYVLGGLFAS